MRHSHLLVIFAGLVTATGLSAKQSDDNARADELFASDGIRHLRIAIAESGMEKLRGYRWHRGVTSAERPEVSCTVREGTDVFTNVAVHLKGAAGSFRPIDSKPSFTLGFDKFVKGQRFHGLEKISLNNSVQDPTRISEKLCRELYSRAGVPAPRADYATVELNGEPLGLYVLVEGWNKQFLKRYFDNTKGNLYDPPLLADIDQELEVACGNFPYDQSELAAVVTAANDPDLARRFQRLNELVDLNCFTRLIAVDMLIWNHDGYVLHSNNYRVFDDIASGRIVFMPHGLDQTFRSPDGPILTGGVGLVSRALLDTPEGRKMVLARLREFRATFFTPQAVTRRVRDLAERIGTTADQDAEVLSSRAGNSWRGIWRRPGFDRFDEAVEDYLDRIIDRFQSVDEQLKSLESWTPLAVDQSLPLTNWVQRTVSGVPEFVRRDSPDRIGVQLNRRGVGAWLSGLWLERGRYVVTGRLKTSGLAEFPGYAGSGAGIRVWSSRRPNLRSRWGWDRRAVRGGRSRGDFGTLARQQKYVLGTTDWKDLRFEFDLRQPLIDLDIACEVAGSAGEAWFDTGSLRIERLPDSRP